MGSPRGLLIVAFVVVSLLLCTAKSSRAQDPDPAFHATDSAAAAFRAAMSRLSSPEFEKRKARRLELQRRGFASILHRTLARDAWGAVLALLKMDAQLDYHLPSNTLMTTVLVQRLPSRKDASGVYVKPYERYEQYPLIEDRRFPKDPWHK